MKIPVREAKPNQQLDRAVVIYDGQCNVCAGMRERLESLDHDGKLEWLDLHACDARSRFSGIDWERANREVHLVHRDGRVTTGSHAVRDIVAMLGGDAGKLASDFLALPGVRDVSALGYELFSNNRGTISRLFGGSKTRDGEACGCDVRR